MLFKSLLVPQCAYVLLAKAIHKAHPYLKVGEIDADSSLGKGRIVILTIYHILEIFSMTTVNTHSLIFLTP